jgi:hypothetical protein
MTNNKTKMTVALWIAIFSFVLLTTAAYAWMTISRDIRVTDLALNVVTENGLEIAEDIDGAAGEWTTVMRMSDILGGDAVLRPVTYSNAAQAFLAPRYGFDGRPDFSEPFPVAKLNMQDDAPTQTAEKYLLAFDFWIRTGSSNCEVCLSEPSEVYEGLNGGGCYVIGRPIWDAAAVSHNDGGRGAQNALRIAFYTYDEADESGGRFVVYEPNADSNGIYEETESIDGETPLTDPALMILQSISGWEEQSPVLRDNVNYRVGGFISENTEILTLKSGIARRVKMYVWLEGQDSDCVNSISGAQLLINLQFKGVMGDSSGGVGGGSGDIVAR